METDCPLQARHPPTPSRTQACVQAGQSRPSQLPGGSDSLTLSGNSHGSWILGSTLLPVSNVKKFLFAGGREVLIHYSKQLLSTHVPGLLGFRGEQDAVSPEGFPF